MTVYNNIFELIKHLQDSASPPPPFVKNEPNGYHWVDASNHLPEELEWVNCGRDFSPVGQLMPSIFSGGLYRGQTEVYSPCCPRIYRGFPLVKRPRKLSAKYRTRFIAFQIKTMWFISLLREHPAVHHARRLGIRINPVAIAHHYGIPTDYLDFTQSIEVAAFFACCESKNKIWVPKSSGQGVIYRLNSIPSATELVGLVTLPRPGEQKAWVVPMRLGADFGKAPQAEVFLFNHTPKGSKYYLGMFDYGKILFPEDPASDLADSIMGSNEIPENFVIEALLRFGCFPNKIKKTLAIYKKRLRYYYGLQVKKKVPISFTKEQLKKLRNYWSDHKRDLLYRGKVIPVRDAGQNY
jgi:hypothetical protein